MRKRVKIALAVLLVAAIGVIAWQVMRLREPVYQGKRLSQWLDEYNRVGRLEQTEPISEAIRAIGTNSLPFLLAHLKHVDSPIKEKFLALVGRQHLVKLPFYGADPYRSASILALHALGAQAAPLFPDLMKLTDNPNTCGWGTMSLLAIGTNSIPTLAKLCQSTNPAVRTQAVLMLAMMKVTPPPWFSWGWNKEPLSGRPLFGLGYAVSEEDVREMVRMLEHPEAAVRRASADAIGLYARPPYTGVAKSSIPSLVQALNDADPDVRQSAGRTLRRIDPEAATKAGVK
jgi:hypothetical protein